MQVQVYVEGWYERRWWWHGVGELDHSSLQERHFGWRCGFPDQSVRVAVVDGLVREWGENSWITFHRDLSGEVLGQVKSFRIINLHSSNIVVRVNLCSPLLLVDDLEAPLPSIVSVETDVILSVGVMDVRG